MIIPSTNGFRFQTRFFYMVHFKPRVFDCDSTEVPTSRVISGAARRLKLRPRHPLLRASVLDDQLAAAARHGAADPRNEKGGRWGTGHVTIVASRRTAGRFQEVFGRLGSIYRSIPL